MIWIDQLQPIINEYKLYKHKNSEPLDGDDVDVLCDLIKAEINLNEGNIVNEEYNGIMNDIVEKGIKCNHFPH
jgi:hypothetical protein